MDLFPFQILSKGLSDFEGPLVAEQWFIDYVLLKQIVWPQLSTCLHM